MVRSQKLLKIGLMLVLKEFIMSLRRMPLVKLSSTLALVGRWEEILGEVFFFAILDSSHLCCVSASSQISLSPQCLERGHLSVSLPSSTHTPGHRRDQRDQTSPCGEVTATAKKMDQSVYV